MKRIVKKALVLLGIFILAVAGYFIWAQKNIKTTPDTKYTSIEDANLPVIYMEMNGRQLNCLHGYLQDDAAVAGRDSLTVLPDDRQLPVVVKDLNGDITGMQYEIRSMDGERLVEKTDLPDWQAEGETVRAVLPIQNLLSKENEYQLILRISTEKHPLISYYTRILWSDNQWSQDMINLALDFSEKTFDYQTARELTVYLETESTADNSSLGHVTLKSSFDQLTWAGLKMERVGEVAVTLKELQGIAGNIQLDYKVARNDEDGNRELYDVSENFTMKWDPQRIYMMNYDRRVNQIFMGERDLFSGKRILLGITDGENIQTKADDGCNYYAFVINRELWCLDQDGEKAVKVFSFRSGLDQDEQADYNRHNVKILSVSGEGDVNFLVYGYMNRGNYEGNVGTTLYTYHMDGNSLDERFYIPANESFERLDNDLKQLSYLNSGNIFYMLMNHGIFSIDLTSNEYMVVADGLKDGSFAVSADKTRLAWQEGTDLYGAKLIHIMNLETGKKEEITNADEKILKVLGFVGNDFVYGLANPGEQLIVNHRMAGIPMESMEIVGDNMNVQSRYKKEGAYICDVEIQESRIHLRKMVKSGGAYIKTEEDTLVCNEELPVDSMAGIGWFASNERRKIYFVQLDRELEKGSHIRASVPKKVLGREDSVIVLKAKYEIDTMMFQAYGGGRMLGSFADFSKAVSACYDSMGLVTDEHGQVLWVRANRSPSRTVKDIQAGARTMREYLEDFEKNKKEEDGTIVLDARGCSLNQILYFIYKGAPVVAYTGQDQYVLIYGYDQYNISVYYPDTGEVEKIGLNDGETYFSGLGNDFVCAIFAG